MSVCFKGVLLIKLVPSSRSDLSVPEREEYIAAVLCLMKRPSQAPKDEFPGALNRFDDFVAFHMTQAGPLHGPVRSLHETHSLVKDVVLLICIPCRQICLPLTGTLSGRMRTRCAKSAVTRGISRYVHQQAPAHNWNKFNLSIKSST